MLIDGKTIANHILEDLSKRVHALWQDHHVQPHLAVIRVGEDPATSSYIAQKEKKAKQIGALISVYKHPLTVSQQQLQESIDYLQQDENIHGIILQLPLPKHLDQETLIQSIQPQLDIDGFVKNSPYPVPIASAVIKILEVIFIQESKGAKGTNGSKENVSFDSFEPFVSWLSSQSITVVGKGKTGGEPIINLLKTKGIEPKVIDSKTSDPEEIIKNSDIVISAVGKKHTITKDMLKKDCILIGIGMGQDEEEQVFGDYDVEDIKDTAKYYTPIPGGVGPVNVACLLENLVVATENAIKL